MSKVGVPVGSTKTHLTQLKVATLVSDIVCTVPRDNISRSGAPPLSLTPPSLSKSQSLCKIQNQKRQEKSQESHHQDSNPGFPTSKSKALPLVQFPPPLQGAPRECRSSSIFSVPDNTSLHLGSQSRRPQPAHMHSACFCACGWSHLKLALQTFHLTFIPLLNGTQLAH